MNFQAFPLDQISDNPWQERPLDQAHVAELAESIADVGLLQKPVARPHPEKPGHAQLALGHHRLAAYRLLAAGPFPNADPAAYQEITLELRELTDLEMAKAGFIENFRRKDPSAIEKAQALQRLIDEFKLGQDEAGRVFGLSQPAVSNLLRLLKLPVSVREAVDRGELPERLARQMVTIAQAAPAEIEKLAKKVVKLAPESRETAITDGLDRILQEHGRDLERAPWDENWLKTPLALGADSLDDLTELRACRGCPYQFKNDWQDACTRPACYDLKEKRWFAKELEQASGRLGLPAAGPQESVTLLKFTWAQEGDARRLLKAAKRHWADLGLRLVASPAGDHDVNRTVFGSKHVALATTDLPAVNLFLKAGAAAGPDGKKQNPKQAAKAVQAAEEKARAARRAERVAALQVEQDVTWLIRHASEWIGAQLPISGGLLRYTVSNLESESQLQRDEFPDLAAFSESELDDAMEKAKGAEAEKLCRQHLALSFLLHDCFDRYGQKRTPKQVWSEILDDVEKLVSAGGGRSMMLDEAGLDLKLPPGWSKLPIHHTAYNCWHCGRFTAQKKLTKRDLEEGWLATVEKGKPVDVACPDCAKGSPAPATLGKDHDGKPKTQAHAKKAARRPQGR